MGDALLKMRSNPARGATLVVRERAKIDNHQGAAGAEITDPGGNPDQGKAPVGTCYILSHPIEMLDRRICSVNFYPSLSGSAINDSQQWHRMTMLVGHTVRKGITDKYHIDCKSILLRGQFAMGLAWKLLESRETHRNQKDEPKPQTTSDRR